MAKQKNIGTENDQLDADSLSSTTDSTLGQTAETGTDRSVNSLDMAGGTGEGTLDKAKDTAATLVDQAKSTATDVYATVADKATSAIEDKKSGLTSGLSTTAETIRRMSGTITEGEANNTVTEYAARYTETAAQKLESAADYFDRTDLRGFARDAEDYARRNPAIFLGAAFALGVLAARFIKSAPAPSMPGMGAEPNDHLLSDPALRAGESERAASAAI